MAGPLRDTFTKIPQSVSILGLDFQVRVVDEVSHTEAADGQIDFDRQEIRLYRGMSEQKMEQTLIHELLHGILVQLGYDAEGSDEHLVQGLAIGLHQIHRQAISSCP